MANTLTAAEALKRILSAKPTTYYVMFDDDGDEFESFTEAAYNKAKKVQYVHVPDRHIQRADDLATVDQPKGIDYDDFLIPAEKVKKITMIEIRDRLTTPEDFKRIKRNSTFRVNLFDIVGYEVEFTTNGINVGCQRYSWEEWERRGTEIINRYFAWNSRKDVVLDLLKLVIENKDRIIGKTTVKKVVKKVPAKKVAAKKTVKKTVAKKAVKKTTKRK